MSSMSMSGSELSSSEKGSADEDSDLLSSADEEFGSDGDLDDGDDGEEDPASISEEDVKKDTSFKYTVMTAEDIMKVPLQMIEEVNEVLQVHPMLARQVLSHFKWNKERAVTEYFTEQEKIFKLAKLPAPDQLKSMADFPDEVECTICFDDCTKANVDALPCGHIFCKECWNDYLTVCIKKEGKSVITCPAQGCGLQMDELSVNRLLRTQAAKDMYMILAAKAFIRDKAEMRWCPGTDCNLAVQAPVSAPEEVTCRCGHQFCFMCGYAYHQPASCSEQERWVKKQELEGENLAFLAKNTKNCPSCKALIWKDQGCQYMRCQTCNTGFCWICLGLFDHKAHTCNKWVGDGAEGDRAEWNRYTFYFERFKAHADSQKFEGKLMAKAEATIQHLTKGGMNWIDAQYIKDATLQLKKARKLLAVSYIMGYFLPKGSHVELFENYQGFLEEACEKLTQLLEASGGEDGAKTRLQVINLATNLESRVHNFVAAVEDDGFAAAAGYKAGSKSFAIEQEYNGWIYEAK